MICTDFFFYEHNYKAVLDWVFSEASWVKLWLWYKIYVDSLLLATFYEALIQCFPPFSIAQCLPLRDLNTPPVFFSISLHSHKAVIILRDYRGECEVAQTFFKSPSNALLSIVSRVCSIFMLFWFACMTQCTAVFSISDLLCLNLLLGS